MRSGLNLTRRRLLFALSLSFTGLLYSTRGMASLPEKPKYKAIANGLISIFSHKESLRLIGQEYIKQIPGKESELALVTSILDGKSGAVFQDSMLLDKKELKKFIQLKVQGDFNNARTVSVEGWVLSKTEADLSALAYLGSVK
jgi:hypothetical protein